MRTTPALALLLVVAAGCALKKIDTREVRGGYTPVESKVPPLPAGCAIAGLEVTDGRGDPKVIGERYLKTASDDRYPVTYWGDTATWARDGATRVLEDAGLRVGGDGPTLVLTLTTVNVEERARVNANYMGTVSLDMSLRGAGGDVRWSRTLTGTKKTVGSHSSDVNYIQTMNHALDRAMITLVSDPAFAAALQSCE